MTKSERKAYEFEALICKSQALAIDVKAMLADNEVRAYRGEPPEWEGGEFLAKAEKMRDYADEFIKLRDRD